MRPLPRWSACIIAFGWLLPSPVCDSGIHAADLADIEPLLKSRCASCHGDETAEGGLNLVALSTDLTRPAVQQKWERIHDRVAAGEMPPRDAEGLAADERLRFTNRLAEQLTEAHAAERGTVLRRLNRREYANTMNDLFGTHLDLAALLPADGRSHEFDTVGSALGVSSMQVQRYLEAAELVLETAIVKTIAKPESRVVRASYADTRGADQFLGSKWLRRDDGAVVFFRQWGYPTGMLRETSVRTSGRYRIRIHGDAWQTDQPVTFSVGATTFARGVEQPVFGYFSVPPGESTTVELEAWVDAGYMISVEPWGIDDGNQIRSQGLENYRGPGLAVRDIEVEGPLVDSFPGKGHRLVFDGLDRREILPRNPADRNRPQYRPRFELLVTDVEKEVVPVLKRVATAAFRRPVTEDQVLPWLHLYAGQVAEGATTEDALRAAVTAIFCSPDFLYLRERPGQLDDFALASRLSYFLTRSAPDSELLQAAESGRLAADTTVLLAQAERLLQDPASDRFIADFTDAWLNLREMDATNPDRVLYPEFDLYLKHSMVDETRAFFRELLTHNLNIRNVVKSDFAMLNERLARHYDIPGVTGPEIRRVSVPEDSVRGGFLSQGSILKVSANGTNTSPVVRGVWVTERILGLQAPPPPAGVPGVEPDIRGASTLRELLDRHRRLETCRSCHELIDPPGFALENFNPIGGWQDRFRSLGDGQKVSLEINGNRVRYRLGPAVDASGSLRDGRTFRDFAEFRDLLARDERILNRAMTVKLLTFSTGREPGFSDRAEIERIVSRTQADGCGVRDLLRHVIESEIFRSK
jgi:hypothetical protein